jgi:hypothetical protein
MSVDPELEKTLSDASKAFSNPERLYPPQDDSYGLKKF